MGNQAGLQASLIERYQQEVAVKDASIAFYKEWGVQKDKALKADQAEAATNSQTIDTLNGKVYDLEDYVSTLKDGLSVCLNSADTSRLRDLFKTADGPSANPTGTPSSTKRP